MSVKLKRQFAQEQTLNVLILLEVSGVIVYLDSLKSMVVAQVSLGLLFTNYHSSNFTDALFSRGESRCG